MLINSLEWGPKPLRKWSKDVAEAIKRNRPINGAGTTIDESTDGMPVNVIDQGVLDEEVASDEETQGLHPFKVVMIDDVSAFVRPGALYDGLNNWNASVTITGFDSTFTVAVGDYVWIVGTVSGGVTTAAAVGSGTSIPARTLFSGSSQTQWTILVAQIVQLDDKVVPQQKIQTDLTLMNMCISGKASIYPFKD